MNGIQKAIKILAICFAVIIIVNIFGWIIFGISFFAHVVDGEEKTEQIQQEDMKEYKYSFEEYSHLNEIEIEIPYSALNIVTGSEELLVQTNGVTYNTEVILKNGKLKIKETDHWLWKTKVTGAINIKLPKGIALNELDIDTGAGKVTIDGVNAENLRLDHGAGKLEITNSNFENTKISTGAGETKIISSILNDLKLEAGVGRVEINGDITGSSKIECGIGETVVNLVREKDKYKIIAEKGIGSLKIEGKEQSGETSQGDSKDIIKIEGGIGSIKVNFK